MLCSRRRPFLIAALLAACTAARCALGAADAVDVKPERLVTADEIRSAPEEQKTRIVGSVAAALADDARLIARIRHEDAERPAPQPAGFEEAVQASEDAAKTVRRAMKAAERASDEAWTEARTQLADEFAAYSVVADRIHAMLLEEKAGPTVASAQRRAISPIPRKTGLQAP